MIKDYKSYETQNGCAVIINDRLMVFRGVCPKYLDDCVREFKNGASLATAFSFLSSDERIYLLTGLTPEDFGRTRDYQDTESPS